MAQIQGQAGVNLSADLASYLSQNNGNLTSEQLTGIINNYLTGGDKVASQGGVLSTGVYKRFGEFDTVQGKVETVTTGLWTGDTGSLSLGGSLGAVGIITKHEIVLAITGGLFVLEALSVMVQVISFKLTGKRIFKMAPIHHHFEKKGWPESTVVIRFWIISIILAMIGLATLKLR